MVEASQRILARHELLITTPFLLGTTHQSQSPIVTLLPIFDHGYFDRARITVPTHSSLIMLVGGSANLCGAKRSCIRPRLFSFPIWFSNLKHRYEFLQLFLLFLLFKWLATPRVASSRPSNWELRGPADPAAFVATLTSRLPEPILHSVAAATPELHRSPTRSLQPVHWAVGALAAANSV